MVDNGKYHKYIISDDSLTKKSRPLTVLKINAFEDYEIYIQKEFDDS